MGNYCWGFVGEENLGKEGWLAVAERWLAGCSFGDGGDALGRKVLWVVGLEEEGGLITSLP